MSEDIQIFGTSLDDINSFASELKSDPNDVVNELQINLIKAGKYQPRKAFNDIDELAESIKAQGVIQPIIVRDIDSLDDEEYEIIAGERRFRAAKLAGLKTIPVIIKNVDDNAAMAIALIENIDRQSMTVSEEIVGIKRLVDVVGRAETAKVLGKKPQYVTKRLRIVDSADYVVNFVEKNYTKDTEGVYELAKLNDQYPKEVEKLVNAWDEDEEARKGLRTQVKKIKERMAINDEINKPIESEIELDFDSSVDSLDDESDINSINIDDELASLGINTNANSTKKSQNKGKSDNENVGDSESQIDIEDLISIDEETLPPVEIETADVHENRLILKTNEGIYTFEIKRGSKKAIINAIKQITV